MEHAVACPIQSEISKIVTAKKPKSEILNALQSLDKIVVNLLSFPSEEKYKHLEKNSPLLAGDFLEIDGVKGLLLFIGFKEEGGDYIHRACDENMKILEEASKRLGYYINQLKLEQYNENFENNKKEIAMNSKTEVKSGGFFGRFCCKKEHAEPCKIGSFLLKHFKKDDISATNKYLNKPLNGSPGYSFNSEGYFHQSCPDRQTSRQKDPRLDIFHKHEPLVKKEKSTIFSFCKKK